MPISLPDPTSHASTDGVFGTDNCACCSSHFDPGPPTLIANFGGELIGRALSFRISGHSFLETAALICLSSLLSVAVSFACRALIRRFTRAMASSLRISSSRNVGEEQGMKLGVNAELIVRWEGPMLMDVVGHALHQARPSIRASSVGGCSGMPSIVSVTC